MVRSAATDSMSEYDAFDPTTGEMILDRGHRDPEFTPSPRRTPSTDERSRRRAQLRSRDASSVAQNDQDASAPVAER
jgi:hypothetical protein